MTLQRGDGYVAMGSSYGAGPLLGDRVPGSPRAAGRTLQNYAHLVAADLGLALTDATFSGATVAELLHGTAAHNATGSGMPPQVDALTPDTRLVTITGGGNDVGYIGRIVVGSVPAPLAWLPFVRRGRRAFDSPSGTDAKFAQLETDLRALIAEIRARSPRAEIVLVEYLSVLPPDDRMLPRRFPRELADWGRATLARLAALEAAVGAETGCRVVPVTAASVDHHAWSAEPWTRHLQLSRTKGAPFHPTPAGMRAVAGMVEAALSA